MKNYILFCLTFIWVPVFASANPFSELYYFRAIKPAAPKSLTCDLAVYGGTPAGVATAIQAAEMGKKVLLFSFNNHVGGLTSGGLTATDVGKGSSIGGLAKEFYKRIGRIRNFSPSAAEKLYLKMLKAAGVEVLFRRCLISVEKKERKFSPRYLWTQLTRAISSRQPEFPIM
jgi:NADPH-dependent 2,4-dienoyl-CoA reductase/sulfur reductase-like enzyme